jgi:hypothetical protein
MGRGKRLPHTITFVLLSFQIQIIFHEITAKYALSKVSNLEVLDSTCAFISLMK